MRKGRDVRKHFVPEFCRHVTHLVSGLPGQEDEVRHRAHEDEHAVKGERDEEEIKISIVPLSDTITHPRAMMVEPEQFSDEVHE